MSHKKTFQEYKKELESKHNNFYIYPNQNIDLGNRTKIKIICPIHGEFHQVISAHKSGQRCPECSKGERANKRKLTTVDFIRDAKAVHGESYEYSLVNYVNNRGKVKIICPIHGEFEQTRNNHIIQKQGCPKCGLENRVNPNTISKDEFINRSKVIHGNTFTYDNVDYINTHTPVYVTCPIHGKFKTIPYNHMNGSGCKSCAMQEFGKRISSKSEFLERSKKIHNNIYTYPNADSEYVNSNSKITIKCSKGHIFKQIAKDHLRGCGCRKCNMHDSSLEKFIKSYLDRNNIKYNENDRIVLDGQELDFYIPDYNLAIECNGIYWHSEKCGRGRQYHLNKTLMCKQKDIRLLHIFENEINFTPKIVLSKLNSIFSINKIAIYGRKCEVREIDSKIKSKFLDKYHIQGNAQSKIRLGLFYKDKLVSVMTFNHPRNDTHEYELNRFCSNNMFYVIGGASKMLKYFERKYKPESLISYADRRWSEGGVYHKLNFILCETVPPKYWYNKLSSKILESKSSYSRKKIERKFEKGELDYFCDIDTEWENMQKNNFTRVWDCGMFAFEKYYK